MWLFGSVKKGKYVEDSILAPGQFIRSLYISMILRAITFLCFELIHLFIAFICNSLEMSHILFTFLISYQMLFLGESLQFYSLSYFILYAHYTTPQIFCSEFLSCLWRWGWWHWWWWWWYRVYSRNWPIRVEWAPFCYFREPFFKKRGPRKEHAPNPKKNWVLFETSDILHGSDLPDA